MNKQSDADAIARIAELEAQLASARAGTAEKIAHDEAVKLYAETEGENAVLRARAEKAEARAAGLARLCQNLVDAHARARKAEDAVDRDPENGDLDEFEDAYACLIIRENECRAALNPDVREEGERE